MEFEDPEAVTDRAVSDVFVVDGDLKGEDFLTMKAEKYVLAVTEWNSSDRSLRHRIAVHAPLQEYITQRAHLSENKVIHNEGNASGSQRRVIWSLFWGVDW